MEKYLTPISGTKPTSGCRSPVMVAPLWSIAVEITAQETDETVAGSDFGNHYGDYIGLTGYAGHYFAGPIVATGVWKRFGALASR